MKVLSLFSGIGGLDLGLERAGMTVVAQSEIDPYARRVLRKHWPDVPNLGDVKTITEADIGRLGRIGLVCGGFPCTNLSRANTHGDRAGLDGPESGLWYEYERIVATTRPRWVVVENVYSAWRDWMPTVRRALYCLGYVSVCFRLHAADVGAPHLGARVFVVAQAHGEGKPPRTVYEEMARLSRSTKPRRQDWGDASPGALGVADGVPARMERLRGLGNAVVPACAEWIGRAILAAP